MQTSSRTMRIVLAGVWLCVAASASAGSPVSRKIGDWSLSSDDTYAEATTTNDSGSVFGYVCLAGGGNCRYYINAGIKCDEGATIPILINSAAGAGNSTLTCANIQGNYFTFLPNQDIEGATESGDMIGFAVPMKDGQFKAMRYSLNGFAAAIKGAQALQGALHASPPPAGKTGDTFL